MLAIKMQMGDIVFYPLRIGAWDGKVVNFNDRGNYGSQDVLGEYKTTKRAQEVVDGFYVWLEQMGGTASTIFTYNMPKE